MTRKFIFIDSISIYFNRFHAQKILNSLLFTDEKDSIWKNWYAKIQNKLKININFLLSEWVTLNYVHSRLSDDAA